MYMSGPSTTAIQLLIDTLSLAETVRERAQTSPDRDLKHQINVLYEIVLSLKEAITVVTDENKELLQLMAGFRRAVRPVPELRQVGPSNFYYVGDKGPFCQPCYDGEGTLIMLRPAEDWDGGVRRMCVLCGEHFYEKASEGFALRRRPQSRRH